MTVMDYVRFRERLKQHEGFRAKEYLDTVGKRTIGYGYNVEDRGEAEYTIVTGHPYTGETSPKSAERLLEHVVLETEQELLGRLPWLTKLDGVRYGVVLDMAYNLGVPRLLKFTTTLEHVRARRYANAARAMLQSKWARQVKGRAERLATHMRDGV